MTQVFSPRTILIAVKSSNSDAAFFAEGLSQWLTARGCTVYVVENSGCPDDYRKYDVELVLVLGGDGTMLGVARAFTQSPVPLLGLNFGKIGFLAELQAEQWQEGLFAVLSGKCDVLERMALGWRILRNGECVHSGYAINDAVISRGALSRVIALELSTGEEHISTVRADGLIFSTPVGTSGYAVSAGGPLVHPDNNVVVVTPICPYLCKFPSIVLPHPMTVQAVVQPASIETFITIDGQEGFPLQALDTVEVFCQPGAMLFARLEANAYFKRLRGRGFIQEFSRK